MCQPDHSNRRKAILRRIVYIVGMSPERDPAADSAALFAEAVSIMARLRGPDGCPWDREQSFDTIRKYTLEETYEVFDAIERRHWNDLCEELGDLLLQVLFYAQMASEPGYFTIADVIAGLNRKLVRRHPHVFGDEASVAAGNAVKSALETTGIDAPQVLRNWDAIKQAEKAEPQPQSSALDSIPRSLPSLLEAAKLGSRARKSGFDWPDVEGIFAKLEEETEELRQAISGHPPSPPPGAQDAIVSEVGDMLFTMVNLARRLNVEPELALRHTNAKFRRRFAAMEAAAPQPLESLSAAQLESLWSQAKAEETPRLTCESGPQLYPDPAVPGIGGACRLRGVAGRRVGVRRPGCGSAPHLHCWSKDRRPGDRRLRYRIARCQPGGRAWQPGGLCHGVARHLRGPSLSALLTCWPSTTITATRASDGGSSFSSGMRLWRAGLAAWNGPSTPWKSRIAFSILPNWGRLFVATRPIFMV